MATNLPVKRIKKIQLPLASGETAADKTYEIIPDKMQSSGFQATLPTLTADTTIAVDTNVVHKTGNLPETITGTKTFSNDDGITISSPTDGVNLELTASGDTGDNEIYFTISDENSQWLKFDLSRGNFSTHYYGNTYSYVLPETNGTVLVAADPASNKNKYLHTNASTGALEWSTVSFTDTNYYAISDFNSSNGTKIATGYSSGTASTAYDLYAPNATASQAGLVTTGDQTFNGVKTFSGSIISEYIYGDGNNGLCLQDSHGDDSSLELTSSCASISGPSVSIAANGSGDIELSTAGNRNISLFSQNYSGTGKAYYKGDEIATVAGTRIEIVDLTTINS